MFHVTFMILNVPWKRRIHKPKWLQAMRQRIPTRQTQITAAAYAYNRCVKIICRPC